MTDDAGLLWDTDVVAADIPYVDALSFTSDTITEADLNEDTTFSLMDILTSPFADLDDSKERSVRMTKPAGALTMVNGDVVAPCKGIAIQTTGQADDIDGFTDIEMGAVPNTRCLIPRFGGAIRSVDWKEALWTKFRRATGRLPEPQDQGP